MKIFKKNIQKLNFYHIDHCYSFIRKEPSLNKFKNLNGWGKKSILSYLKKNNSLCFGYTYKKNLIGFIISNYTSVDKVCEVEISLIFVKKEFRRLGIARTLIDYVLEKIFFCDITNVYLEFSDTNNVAKSFYEYYGFKNISIRKKYYFLKNNKKEDAMVLNYKKNNKIL